MTCLWCHNSLTPRSSLNWKRNHLAPLTLVTTSLTHTEVSKIQTHSWCVICFKDFVLERRVRGAVPVLRSGLLLALSNPHLSSKAAKSRASRMFSSGSQVLYLHHNGEGKRCALPHGDLITCQSAHTRRFNTFIRAISVLALR